MVKNIVEGARSFCIMMAYSVPVVGWLLDTHQHLDFQERNYVLEDLLMLDVPLLLLQFSPECMLG